MEHITEDFTPADELGFGLTHFPPFSFQFVRNFSWSNMVSFFQMW